MTSRSSWPTSCHVDDPAARTWRMNRHAEGVAPRPWPITRAEPAGPASATVNAPVLVAASREGPISGSESAVQRLRSTARAQRNHRPPRRTSERDRPDPAGFHPARSSPRPNRCSSSSACAPWSFRRCRSRRRRALGAACRVSARCRSAFVTARRRRGSHRPNTQLKNRFL